MPSQPGYYRHPTVHGSTVVFVCEDDLWSVSLEGGVAQRLTASAGQVSFARLSPNGKMLAYTSTEEGAPEAYVMPAAGGPARRLTWMSSLLRTVGWATCCATASSRQLDSSAEGTAFQTTAVLMTEPRTNAAMRIMDRLRFQAGPCASPVDAESSW